MNSIETNALRIAELLGVKTHISIIGAFGTVIDKIPNTCVINKFREYSGLMPIVFECNKNELDTTIDIDMNDVVVTQYKSNHKNIFTYGIYEENEFIKSEKVFIQAIQLACIKYLELKNV